MADTKKEVKEKESKVSDKLLKIIDQVAELSVLELSELVKALEDKFQVHPLASGAAPAAAATPAAGAAPAEEEKSTFTIVLTETGTNKIGVIQAIREIKPDLGLKEAKDLTEATPAEIATDVKKEEAQKAKARLEEAGAKVDLK